MAARHPPHDVPSGIEAEEVANHDARVADHALARQNGFTFAG
jgi:hypothetical protein